MKFILLNDFNEPTEVDDGIYLVHIRYAGEEPPAKPVLEAFSEGDLWHIRKKAPVEANSIALTDDWMFYNTESGMLFDYVFHD